MKTVVTVGTMNIFNNKVKIYISRDGSRYREPLASDQTITKAICCGKIVSLVQLWPSSSPSPQAPAGARARVDQNKDQNIAAIAIAA